MKHYHVEENGNILILEAKQKPERLDFDYWKETLNEAIESTRKN